MADMKLNGKSLGAVEAAVPGRGDRLKRGETEIKVVNLWPTG
jgi:hypothetical protein